MTSRKGVRVGQRPALATGLVSVLMTGLCAMSAPPGGVEISPRMSFFVTSSGLGRGGDLGGLEGADAHCRKLAKAAGSLKTDWRAYLSAAQIDGFPGMAPGVNARDRIGKGPWFNAKDVMIARDLAELHSDHNNISKQTALTEQGEIVPGAGDALIHHDILTGSDPQGLYSTAGGDTTCHNWTSGDEGSAIVGHSDRRGPVVSRQQVSWNSSHGTPGCDTDALKSVGGGGLFYCFAGD